MSGSFRDFSFAAIPEEKDDSQQIFSNTETLSPTPAPSTSTSLPSDPAPLLTRLRSRISSRRASSRLLASNNKNIDANFDSDAAEFISGPKMPPKRKASSMGKSGMSLLSTSRKNGSTSQSLEQPLVHSDEVFGRNFPTTIYRDPSGDTLEGLLEDGDPYGLDILEFDGMGIPNQNQGENREHGSHGRMVEALSLTRNRIKDVLHHEPVLSNSAILFSYDQDRIAAQEGSDSTRVRYLPLGPATASGRRGPVGKDTPLAILPRHRKRIDEASSAPVAAQVTWPPNRVPIELFDLIAAHLSRDAVKSMRLVNHEFEEKVSCALFYTSVVPFNTELYDMVDEDTRVVSRTSGPFKGKGKGKGKAESWDISENRADSMHGSLHWTNARDDAEGKVYKGHGLRVFQGFGPHIRKFGMSFDVLEGRLSQPPLKRELDHVESYHGTYDWPSMRYTRFANLAGLERTADETLRMKAAFSHLEKVHDLALSVDSSLGWLNGPDKSIHARVFQRQAPIFGHSRLVPDSQTQNANEFWATIQSCIRSLGPSVNPKEISLSRRPLPKHPSELTGLRGTRYADQNLWPSIAADRAAPTISTGLSEDLKHGIMYTTFSTPDSAAQCPYDKSALVPSELRKEQKEWLLETEWAQRAFLECYVLAITDNPNIFAMVRTLAITKMSSGFLPLLARESFWDALPNLEDLTILVKPDWRSVERDNAGFAETCPQNPSEAVRAFHRCILRDRICLRAGITKLKIGWAAGGEHADGIFARNNHIMPAPITQLEHTTAATFNSGLVFKYVEHLTLTNCWMTPPMLVDLVKCHAKQNLKVLTLDSVSLTAHPRFLAGGQGAVHQQVAQAFAGLTGNQGAGALNVAPVVPLNVQNMFNQQNQQVTQNLVALQQAHHNLMANGFGATNAPTNNVNALPFWNAAVPPPAAVPHNPLAALHAEPGVQPAHVHWSLNHRKGSWPEVLDKISPGPTLTDFLPPLQPWEGQHPQRAPTVLQMIELKSCGYAKLYHSTAFDQFSIEGGHDHHLSLWFRSRQAALAPAMLTNTDTYLGRIVQHIPQREQDALQFAWRLRTGWDDRAKAEESEYDGLLAGGTGRISGAIGKSVTIGKQPG